MFEDFHVKESVFFCDHVCANLDYDFFHAWSLPEGGYKWQIKYFTWRSGPLGQVLPSQNTLFPICFSKQRTGNTFHRRLFLGDWGRLRFGFGSCSLHRCFGGGCGDLLWLVF